MQCVRQTDICFNPPQPQLALPSNKDFVDKTACRDYHHRMASFLGVPFADCAVTSCCVSDRNLQGPPIPQYAYYTIGRFLRLVSVYAAHHYLVQSQIPVVLFVFYCLLGATALFTIIQQPWKGRNLPRAQVTHRCSTHAFA